MRSKVLNTKERSPEYRQKRIALVPEFVVGLAKSMPNIKLEQGEEAVTRTISILQSASYNEDRLSCYLKVSADSSDSCQQIEVKVWIVSNGFSAGLLKEEEGLKGNGSVLPQQDLLKVLQLNS